MDDEQLQAAADVLILSGVLAVVILAMIGAGVLFLWGAGAL